MTKLRASLVAIATPVAFGAHAVPLTVDGSGDVFGMFPIVSYGLVVDGDDILPAGDSTGFGLFGLFDTGADGVYVNDNGSNFFFPGNDDAGYLGISGTTTVDVRLNGLGATVQEGTNILSPIQEPGSAFGAQVEVSGVAVGPEPLVDITLIGAPVANEIAALIDYTTPVTRAVSIGSFVGPDITFMQSADADAFTTDVELELTPFGTVGENAAGEDRGERYYLRDVALNLGGASALGTSYDLFWDSGTNVTLVSNAIALALGLDLGTPDFTGIVGGQTLSGFTLDSIIMSGLGGAYTVMNAQIFVDPSLVPFGGAADAIIGSNLFSQTSLLFNGPGNTLGIGVTSVPEPETWLLLTAGLLGFALQRRLPAR
jgi:hypothetical protein